MRVGVPTEVKDNEFRVALTPAGVAELIGQGHAVLVQRGAGVGSSITDEEYVHAGAKLADSAEQVWAEAELLLKVKEPLPEEYPHLREGLLLFTYLHLAANKACTQALLDSGITSIAYETVQLPDSSLPLLAPMSEVAGRMSVQAGAHYLERPYGGRGVLLAGVPGVAPADVVVLGGGISGSNAAVIALGMGAHVTVIDRNVGKLRELDRDFRGRLSTMASTTWEVERAVREADLVIGAVLVPGAKAPVLVPDALVAQMRPGSVLVDIAVDQGGCFESTRPTTHADPVFTVSESLFYCVANMPGAVPRTSTLALTNVTLPYVTELADRGLAAAGDDPSLAAGVSTVGGDLVSEPVAQAHDLAHRSLSEVLAA